MIFSTLQPVETSAKSGKNLKIALIDAGDRLGKKLAATGNGQGNVSNKELTAEHYHGGNVDLVEKIALTCVRKQLQANTPSRPF